jgi:psiF repeat
MTMSKILGVAFAALMLSAGVSLAEPAPATAAAKPAVTAAAPANTAKPAKVAKIHGDKKHGAHGKFAAKSEKGQECSAQADTQGLHGKARRHFRKECMKTAKTANLSAPVKSNVQQATAVKAPAATATPTTTR